MNTSMIAMAIAGIAVLGLVVSLGGLSLLIGAVDFFFGKPKLTFLKSKKNTSFGFAFHWNHSKEPARIDQIKLRLFNPFGSPTQLDLSKSFEAQASSFAKEVDFGQALQKLLNAKGFAKARIQIEVSSSQDGLDFQFEMSAPKFKDKLLSAKKTVGEYNEKELSGGDTLKSPIEIPSRSFIADTVPGKGAQLAVPSNPMFAAYFSGGSGAGAKEEVKEQENFNIEKVWIAPGCIVCNACEDIYPEVFDVTADTCLIRPNAPLDDGLRIEEAAEACPVEVIKYTKAS